jgi:uncharacterized protein
MAVFLGIDLAGSPRRPTGMALLDEKLRCRTWVRYLDEEIIADVDLFKPLVVGVDAPLGLPRGRESLESRGPPHFRECDLELRRRGIRFFPITIGAMRALTERGIRLSKLLRSKGYTVFEDISGRCAGCPRTATQTGKHTPARQGAEEAWCERPLGGCVR